MTVLTAYNFILCQDYWHLQHFLMSPVGAAGDGPSGFLPQGVPQPRTISEEGQGQGQGEGSSTPTWGWALRGGRCHTAGAGLVLQALSSIQFHRGGLEGGTQHGVSTVEIKECASSSRQCLLLLCSVFKPHQCRAQQGVGENVSEQYVPIWVLNGCALISFSNRSSSAINAVGLE